MISLVSLNNLLRKDELHKSTMMRTVQTPPLISMSQTSLITSSHPLALYRRLIKIKTTTLRWLATGFHYSRKVWVLKWTRSSARRCLSLLLLNLRLLQQRNVLIPDCFSISKCYLTTTTLGYDLRGSLIAGCRLQVCSTLSSQSL